jgi:hypothetical protein
MEDERADEPTSGSRSLQHPVMRPLTRVERIKVGQLVKLHLKVFLGSLGLLQTLGALWAI